MVGPNNGTSFHMLLPPPSSTYTLLWLPHAALRMSTPTPLLLRTQTPLSLNSAGRDIRHAAETHLVFSQRLAVWTRTIGVANRSFFCASDSTRRAFVPETWVSLNLRGHSLPVARIPSDVREMRNGYCPHPSQTLSEAKASADMNGKSNSMRKEPFQANSVKEFSIENSYWNYFQLKIFWEKIFNWKFYQRLPPQVTN